MIGMVKTEETGKPLQYVKVIVRFKAGADIASTVTPSIAGLVTLRAGALVQDDQTLAFGTGSDGTQGQR